MKKLWFFALLVFQINGKIIIEKLQIQNDPTFSDIKYSVKDQSTITIESTILADADDILLEAAAYSKVDGVYNVFVKADPIHICKIHEHEDPLVKFMHDEMGKFGNLTKACPLKKGTKFFIQDFKIDAEKFPMPLPIGEFRVDVNGSVLENGKVIHQSCSEVMFKTIKD